jgi:hypothetical protein
VKNRIKSPDREIFQETQNVIWGLLKFECFPRFKLSPFFNGHLTKKQVNSLSLFLSLSFSFSLSLSLSLCNQ